MFSIVQSSGTYKKYRMVKHYDFLALFVFTSLKVTLFFFLISKKNILKEPQEYKRPTKEYRGGHKQRENTRENKKQIE